MPNPPANPSRPIAAANAVSTTAANPPAAPLTHPQRGDIYWVNIPQRHTVGHEQYKRRPWLIVSNNAIVPLGLVVGVPLSFQLQKKNRLFRISILATEIIREVGASNPLDPGERIALTEQVRTLSIDRLERPRSGRVTDTALFAVEAGVAFVLDIQ